MQTEKCAFCEACVIKSSIGPLEGFHDICSQISHMFNGLPSTVHTRLTSTNSKSCSALHEHLWKSRMDWHLDFDDVIARPLHTINSARWHSHASHQARKHHFQLQSKECSILVTGGGQPLAIWSVSAVAALRDPHRWPAAFAEKLKGLRALAPAWRPVPSASAPPSRTPPVHSQVAHMSTTKNNSNMDNDQACHARLWA